MPLFSKFRTSISSFAPSAPLFSQAANTDSSKPSYPVSPARHQSPFARSLDILSRKPKEPKEKKLKPLKEVEEPKKEISALEELERIRKRSGHPAVQMTYQ